MNDIGEVGRRGNGSFVHETDGDVLCFRSESSAEKLDQDLFTGANVARSRAILLLGGAKVMVRIVARFFPLFTAQENKSVLGIAPCCVVAVRMIVATRRTIAVQRVGTRRGGRTDAEIWDTARRSGGMGGPSMVGAMRDKVV